jgi:MATE family multidrug resistance protein
MPIALSATLIVGIGAAGNQRLGVLVLIVVNLIHIPLLLVLGLGWFTHHPFGIVGAGVSSLLSETIGALFAIAYIARRPQYHVLRERSFSWPLAVRCARLGFPETVFLMGVTTPDVVIVAMLAPLGAIFVAAFRALNVVSDLTFIVPSPLQSAAQIVIGQRLGAGDPQGARWFLERATGVALGLRLHAQCRGRNDCRPTAGPAHDHVAPQRLGDGLVGADPRVGRHALLDDRRPSL